MVAGVRAVTTGAVALEGMRGPNHQTWIMGPDFWGLETRPDFSPSLLALYQERQQAVLAGKLKPIARLWQESELPDGMQQPWLRSWMAFQSGKMFGANGQWEEA